MTLRQLGFLVHERRLELCISQRDLCEGLCSQQALSALERGKRTLPQPLLQGILERLGLSEEDLEGFFNEFSYSDYKHTIQSIRQAMIERNFDEVERLLQKIDAKSVFLEGLGLQFLLLTKANIAREKNGDSERAISLLEEAICITQLNYDEKTIANTPLSKQEIEIVNSIAIAYCERREMDRGIDLFYALKQSVDKFHCKGRPWANSIVFITSCLTKHLGLSGRYEEAIALCREAKPLAVQYNCLYLQPLLTLSELCCLHEIGKTEDAIELLPLAYFGCVINGDYDTAYMIKNYAKDKLGVRISSGITRL